MDRISELLEQYRETFVGSKVKLLTAIAVERVPDRFRFRTYLDTSRRPARLRKQQLLACDKGNGYISKMPVGFGFEA